MKPVFSYLILVGTPLIGLLVILHLGQGLSAPISVRGLWSLDADFSPLKGSPCADLFNTINQPALSISQSGKHLLLSLNAGEKVALRGECGENTITADLLNRPDDAALSKTCVAARTIHIEATVNTEAAQTRLNGLLTIPACPECGPVPFTAIRQQQAGKKGEVH